MATLDWHLRRTDGVTLVELLVTSDSDCRVRIESALEPVWPPREQGLPAAGWHDTTYETHLDAGDRLVVGYASPADPVEPPAELQTAPPVEHTSLSPREVIRALGDGRPPRDVVSPQETTTRPTGSASERDAQRSPDRADRSAGRPLDTVCDPDANASPVISEPELPVVVESWLASLDARIAAAERSIARDDSPLSHPLSDEPLTSRRSLARQLAIDRSRLDSLATRRRALACRLDALDIPAESGDLFT